jgi:beta-lactamase regulating signal transducer with metallopeptidase domain
MTTAELIVALARANLAAAAAILAVLALRTPARRAFGAHLAYALWLMVPAAAAGALTPAIGSPGWAPATAEAGAASRAWLAGSGRAHGLAALWLAGLAANAALAIWRQSRFCAAARAGRAGPAVVGILRPRLVTPADFDARFSAAERRLIRAHELAHIDREDGRVAALAVVAAWICWFNPLAHVALSAFRADQELACDATVMQRMPKARRAYAAALLRAEPPTRDLAQGLVFGSAWLSPAHPLAARLAALARRAPDQMRHDLGVGATAALAIASFAAAWAAQPSPAGTPSPAASIIILMELRPADPEQAAWVYRAAPPLPPAR